MIVKHRIAMIGPFGFHPNKTMRSRAFRLARALAARGHVVKIVMPPWQTPAEAGRRWEENGVAIEYVSLSAGILPTVVRLIRAASAFRPDIVHCFKPKAYSGLAAFWFWQRGGLPLVVDSDDWEGWGGWNEIAPYGWLQKRFFAWQERWGLRHCHALTVASRTLQSLAWSLGSQPDRVHYLPNGPGISSDASQAAAKRAAIGLAHRPTLLLYSRLFEFDTGRLVNVLAGVATAVPDLAVLAVGSSLYAEQGAELRQKLAAANLLDRFTDVGWQDEGELPHLLAAADVGLYLMDDNLLNRTKCPVKLVDMTAVGLPVVAENVGQVGEYLRHNESGRLRPSGDLPGLISDLVDLLRNDAERQRLGANAARRAQEQFSWDVLARELEQVYAKLTGLRDRSALGS
jgi:glycosyltransferase involved in cell wall biosynthesis